MRTVVIITDDNDRVIDVMPLAAPEPDPVPELTDDEARNFASEVLRCADPDHAGTQRLARVVLRLLDERVRTGVRLETWAQWLEASELTSPVAQRIREFLRGEK